jgi:hypothetical protein
MHHHLHLQGGPHARMAEPIARPTPELGVVRKLPEVGGLHHHYEPMTAEGIVLEALRFR